MRARRHTVRTIASRRRLSAGHRLSGGTSAFSDPDAPASLRPVAVERLALYQQPGHGTHPETNLAAIAMAAKEAAEAECALIVFPELFLGGRGLDRADVSKLAEPATGPTLARVRALAELHGIAIAVGYAELAETEGGRRVYNSVAVVGSTGQLLCNSRKCHPSLAESEIFDTTDEPVSLGCFKIGVYTFGILTAEDVVLPEPARLLALSGVQCAVVVCSHPPLQERCNILGSSVDKWALTLSSRAIENSMAFACACYADRSCPLPAIDPVPDFSSMSPHSSNPTLSSTMRILMRQPAPGSGTNPALPSLTRSDGAHSLASLLLPGAAWAVCTLSDALKWAGTGQKQLLSRRRAGLYQELASSPEGELLDHVVRLLAEVRVLRSRLPDAAPPEGVAQEMEQLQAAVASCQDKHRRDLQAQLVTKNATIRALTLDLMLPGEQIPASEPVLRGPSQSGSTPASPALPAAPSSSSTLSISVTNKLDDDPPMLEPEQEQPAPVVSALEPDRDAAEELVAASPLKLDACWGESRDQQLEALQAALTQPGGMEPAVCSPPPAQNQETWVISSNEFEISGGKWGAEVEFQETNPTPAVTKVAMRRHFKEAAQYSRDTGIQDARDQMRHEQRITFRSRSQVGNKPQEEVRG